MLIFMKNTRRHVTQVKEEEEKKEEEEEEEEVVVRMKPVSEIRRKRRKIKEDDEEEEEKKEKKRKRRKIVMKKKRRRRRRKLNLIYGGMELGTFFSGIRVSASPVPRLTFVSTTLWGLFRSRLSRPLINLSGKKCPRLSKQDTT